MERKGKKERERERKEGEVYKRKRRGDRKNERRIKNSAKGSKLSGKCTTE